MISPLCEKIRSTGAELAGTHNTLSNNGFSAAYCPVANTAANVVCTALMWSRYRVSSCAGVLPIDVGTSGVLER